MNKNNVAMYMPIIYALASGKKIEVYSLRCDVWNAQEDINFTLPPEMYRIKSEPKHIFVNEYGDVITAHHNKDSALVAANKANAKRIAVEYVEVRG